MCLDSGVKSNRIFLLVLLSSVQIDVSSLELRVVVVKLKFTQGTFSVGENF